jgi:hypothetical protein
VVLLIDEKKTSSLARAAAAFSQDVAKCRRIVLFAGSSPGRQVPLPFLGLPSLSGEIDAPPRDVEVAARSVITGSLADAFLNEDLADTEVLKLAEEEEP